MTLFRRSGKKSSEPLTLPGHDDLVLISSNDLAPVIDGLTAIVVEGMSTFSFDDDTLGLLQVGLPFLTGRDCSTNAILAGQTVARLGFLARSAEFAKFNAARMADLELLDALQARLAEAGEEQSTGEVMAELAADMVQSESIDPTPDEGGPSWTLPGIGGTARAALRDHLLVAMSPQTMYRNCSGRLSRGSGVRGLASRIRLFCRESCMCVRVRCYGAAAQL